MAKVYAGAVGILIEVETGIDLTYTTVAKILVRKPSGKTTEWVATPSGTKLQYTTKAGDLDESGLYVLQAYVELMDGSVLLGETARFHVFEQFE